MHRRAYVPAMRAHVLACTTKRLHLHHHADDLEMKLHADDNRIHARLPFRDELRVDVRPMLHKMQHLHTTAVKALSATNAHILMYLCKY